MAKRKKKKNQEEQGYTLTKEDTLGIQLAYLQTNSTKETLDLYLLAAEQCEKNKEELDDITNGLGINLIFASRVLDITLKQARRTFINAKGFLGDPTILKDVSEDIAVLIGEIEIEKKEDGDVYSMQIPLCMSDNLAKAIELMYPIMQAFDSKDTFMTLYKNEWLA